MATLCRRLTTLLSRLAAKLSRVYHIRPFGRHFHLDIASGISPTGALATFKSLGPLPTLPVGGTVTPFGVVDRQIGGPSLVTIPQSVDGTITPSSTLFNEATGLGIIITQAVDGQILPTGEPANEASGPSLVTLTQSVSGQVGPTASVAKVTNASTGLVTDSRAGTITPAGAVATLVSGPSFVTLTQSVAGSITPAGAVATSIGSVTVVFNQQATAVATPAGSVARVVTGPSLVTVTKSVAGTITPAAAPVNVVKNPLTGISTQAVDGTITPSATIVRQVSGPSLITVTASRAGTITPAGTVARSITGSNQFQINKQGVITPAGVVGRVVTGPSFVTVVKSVASSMSPSGTLGRVVTGPSLITVPKSVSGSITPHGTQTRLVTGNTTVQKAITGRITPVSTLTKVVKTIGTTPNPIYTGWMSHDDITTWPNPPHFTTTQIVPTPSTIAAIRTAARANGFKLALRLSGNSPLYAGHDTSGQPCCFDLTKWKNAVARFQNLISSADADWLLLNYLIDEPYINNWYGNTLSTNILKQMAQYSRQLYPWLGTTIRSESKYLTGNQLPAGGWGGFLTHGWANYNRSAINNNLTYSQYFTLNTNEFAAVGIGCILGQNIFNSGLGGSGIPSSDGISGHWFASAQEIKDCFDAAYPFTGNKIYQIWKQAETGDSTEPYIPYFTRSDYVSAWDYLVNRGANRGGTFSNPIAVGDNWQTKVNAQPQGAVFTILAGVHRLQSVVPKANQSFIGQDGAIMSGARVLTGWQSDGAGHWYVTGQTQQNTYNPNYECQLNHDGCFYPEQLWVNDVLYEHMTTLAAVTAGSQKWFFDYAADRIYIATNPSGQIIETSVATSAFTGSQSGVIIKNLIVEKYANAAQVAVIDGGPSWLIESNEVRDNHGTGIHISANGIMRNNYVHHQGQLGISASGVNGLVEGNEVAYNNTAFFGGGHYGETGGSKFVLTTGLIVRNNFVHHNHGPGLWTDINNINTLYEGNTVEDNDWRGIFHEISFACIIRNNIVRRNGFNAEPNAANFGAGILVANSPDVEVYGNTVTDNHAGIMGLDGDRQADHVSSYGEHICANLNVHNNTVIQRDAGRAAGIFHSNPNDDPYSPAANNVWANNIYYRILGTTKWRWTGSLDVTESAWRAVQDAGSTFGS